MESELDMNPLFFGWRLILVWSYFDTESEFDMESEFGIFLCSQFGIENDFGMVSFWYEK